jgi:hypothetical protein
LFVRLQVLTCADRSVHALYSDHTGYRRPPAAWLARSDECAVRLLHGTRTHWQAAEDGLLDYALDFVIEPLEHFI